MKTYNDKLVANAQSGKTSGVEAALARGADVNSCDQYGMSALALAAHNGHTDTVVTLLQRGADPNLTTPDNATPLFWAVVRGYQPVVKALLEHGAQPDIARATEFQRPPPDSKGVAPLHVAISHGWEDIAILLLLHGAHANHIDNGRSALDRAREEGLSDVVRFLRTGWNPEAG